MRKEIFLAIFVGIIFGLIVTYGIYRANKAINNKKTGYKQEKSILPTPISQAEGNLELNIVQPKDRDVYSQELITFKGSTSPQAIVVIMSDNEEYFAQTNDNGVFNLDIKLNKGANTYKVYATDLEEVTAAQVIHVVYSTFIDENQKTEEKP